MPLRQLCQFLMQSKILKIAIVGKTNAGKSTLINKIVGEKISIQNKKINTTQDVIIGIKNINKTQMLFFDTPGSNFMKSINAQLKNFKINLWSGIDDSDLIIYLIDSSRVNLTFLFEQLKKLEEIKKRIVIVFNKIDLINSRKTLSFIDEINSNFVIEDFFFISSKKNIGINNLINNLEKYSYVSKWIYRNDEITNKDDKFIINELLRESILKFLHKEIPYNLIIETSHYKILKNKEVKIKQKIFTNESRYKKIILGKKGEMIKKIREQTQKKIQLTLKIKVHLYIDIINTSGT